MKQAEGGCGNYPKLRIADVDIGGLRNDSPHIVVIVIGMTHNSAI
jgi:hypothetical protein